MEAKALADAQGVASAEAENAVKEATGKGNNEKNALASLVAPVAAEPAVGCVRAPLRQRMVDKSLIAAAAGGSEEERNDDEARAAKVAAWRASIAAAVATEGGRFPVAATACFDHVSQGSSASRERAPLTPEIRMLILVLQKKDIKLESLQSIGKA